MIDPGLGDVEDLFRSLIAQPLADVARLGEADVVVGIPFYNEADTIEGVVRTAADGLAEYFPSSKCVIIAVGCPAGHEALEVVNRIPPTDGIEHFAFLLDNERASGKGWAVWALMEIARNLGADLAILEADLRSRDRDGVTEGLIPEWVNLLVEPIQQGGMDMVVSRFARHHLESPISSLVFYPILAAVYDCPIHDLTGGQWGISYRLLRTFLQTAQAPPSVEVGGYGVDTWLATTAAARDARVCEANLGIKIHKPSVAKAELVLTQAARVLFDQAAVFYGRSGRSSAGGQPMIRPLPVFGAQKPHRPDPVEVVSEQLLDKFQQGFARFRSLYQWVLPGETYDLLETLAETDIGAFRFPHRLWVEIVYHLLLASAFTREYAEGDLIGSFTAAYSGYVAGYALDAEAMGRRLSRLDQGIAEELVAAEADLQIRLMMDEFMRMKPGFLAAWEKSAEDLKPPVPNVTYREFIPGVPLVVPSELPSPSGSTVTANAVYEAVFHRYQEEFEDFVHRRLGVPRGAGSAEIAARVREFMLQVEAELAEVLLPGDLTTVSGTERIVKTILRYFRRGDGYSLVPEMSSWLMWRYPPMNLITRMGYSHVNELLEAHQPNDILALASWTEDHDYRTQVGTLIRDSLRTEHMAPYPLEQVVADIEDFPSLAEMKESPSLSRMAGRIVLSNLRKGMGGELPRLRYLTTVAKTVVESERFGELWRGFGAERKDFAEKVTNALEGHWGQTPLSAHNIFENAHQRIFVRRLRDMAAQIRLESPDDESRARLAGHLLDMADSYHLALTLPDGTFIPCSAWTWASYSFKGGTGVPTPLSLHVERDWSSSEFLREYFAAIGGDDETVERTITELMSEGLEHEDLAPRLLGGIQEAQQVLLHTAPAEGQPPAGELGRFSGNPVLGPIREHSWESKYLLNPGAIRLNGKVYLVYRAVGDDDISRLGLAVSDDGFHFGERLDDPIFEPKTASEAKGVEDPRLTLIGDRVYMAYTAYSSPIAQVSVASISVQDFINYRWGLWHRHGLVFPGFTDKDAALFPGVFDGKYAMLHRVDPHIWITFSPHLRCPWPRKEHKILAGSRSGMVWDSLKIGGGAQPIETEYGWLMVYHGVDHSHIYRLGIMLLGREDPTNLLYRSPNFVLGPVEQFEVGGDGGSWVPNVVFTCGAVPRQPDKDVLSAADEILVYYGAADSVIAVATARIADIIPSEFR